MLTEAELQRKVAELPRNSADPAGPLSVLGNDPIFVKTW
jgi:hypothetical protein